MRSTFSRAYWIPPALVATLAFLLLSGCCPPTICPHTEYETSPDLVSLFHVSVMAQPTSVIIRGTNLTNPIAMTTDDNGFDGTGVSIASWTFSNGEIHADLTISDNADLGAHAIIAVFGDNNEPTSADVSNVYVTCQGCTPPPRLASLTVVDGSRFIRQGETKLVRFLGREFLNNSPVVQFHPEDPGLSLPPNTTITVQRQGTTDYFDVPIVTAPGARTGVYRVRLITSGGRSAWNYLLIGADFKLTPPGWVPIITSLSPSPIYAGDTNTPTDFYVKVEGSGFGPTAPALTIQPGDATISTQRIVPPTANPDRTMVLRLRVFSTGVVHLMMQNLTTGQLSPQPLIFHSEPIPSNVPVLSYVSGSAFVRRGNSATLQINCTVNGAPCSGAADAGWTGSPGLHFSNTSGNPIHVTVTADANAALTGDEATNITLSLADTRYDRSTSLPILVLP